MNGVNQLNITNIQDSSAFFTFNLTEGGVQKLFEAGIRTGEHYLGNYYKNDSFVAFCSLSKPGILQSILLSELLDSTEAEQVAQALKIGAVYVKLSPLPLKVSTQPVETAVVAPYSPHAASETDTELADETPSRSSATPRSVASSCASNIPVLRRPSVQSTTSSVGPSKVPSGVILTIEKTVVELDLEDYQKQTLKNFKVTSATPCQMNVKNYALDFEGGKGKKMLFLTPTQKQKIQKALGSFQTNAPVVTTRLF